MNPLASLGFIIRQKYTPRPQPGKWPELVTSFIKPALISVYYLETAYFSLHFSCLQANPNFFAQIPFIIKARQLPKVTHSKTRKVSKAACINCLLGGPTPHSKLQRGGISHSQTLLAWGAKRLLLSSLCSNLTLTCLLNSLGY